MAIPEPGGPLTGRLGSPYAIPLGSGPEPAQLVAALDVPDRPAVLWGNWFGGGVVVLRCPLRNVRVRTAAEVITLIDDQPSIVASAPRDDHPRAAEIGGGWVCCLGFSPGVSAAYFYDSLLRWRPGAGWTFEALGLRGRENHLQAELGYWRRLLATADGLPRPAGPLAAPFSTIDEPALTRQRYLAGVEEAIGRINAGKFYQLNLCTRLWSRSFATPASLFAKLAARLDPAYGALLITQADDHGGGAAGKDTSPERVQGDVLIPSKERSSILRQAQDSDRVSAVVSMSPELFLSVRGRKVITSPIKGTAARQPGETDSPILRASVKDAAENIMIVDLMRNDLSRICRPGTVQVDRLLDLQAHPGVWHLVSTVSGQLENYVSTGQLLRAAFPPGSVTGAPKSTALQGISALEPHARGAYTGALGLVSPIAGSDFNVLIRTLECKRDRLELGVGGGITVDSAPITEWYECLAKAAPLASTLGAGLDPRVQATPSQPNDGQLAAGLLETMLAIGNSVLRLAAHLARLDRSCRELYGEGIPGDLAGRIAALVTADRSAPRRRVLRVVARPAAGQLNITISLTPYEHQVGGSSIRCAERPAFCWRHKWADRAQFAAAEQTTAPDLPYFLTPPGPDRFVTEASRGNVFCLGDDGTWLTPPLDEHLLPGVTRREVLDIFSRTPLPLRIEPFTAEQLRRSGGAFWTSSLRGAVVITAVDGHLLPASDRLVSMINAELGTG